jgi:hypothetical protein
MREQRSKLSGGNDVAKAMDYMQIPTQAGHLFQLDGGHRSDLKPATIPI